MTISVLPDDMQKAILTFVDPSDQLKACIVCKKWRDFMTDPLFKDKYRNLLEQKLLVGSSDDAVFREQILDKIAVQQKQIEGLEKVYQRFTPEIFAASSISVNQESTWKELYCCLGAQQKVMAVLNEKINEAAARSFPIKNSQTSFFTKIGSLIRRIFN